MKHDGFVSVAAAQLRAFKPLLATKVPGEGRQVHVFGERWHDCLVVFWPKKGPDPGFAVLLIEEPFGLRNLPLLYRNCAKNLRFT